MNTRAATEAEITEALERRDRELAALLERIAFIAQQPPERSIRGFMRHALVPGMHNDFVRVYESSAAEHPCIWLQVDQPQDLNELDGLRLKATVHLPVEAAKVLRDQLSNLIGDEQ